MPTTRRLVCRSPSTIGVSPAVAARLKIPTRRARTVGPKRLPSSKRTWETEQASQSRSLKRRWRDGTSHVIIETIELVEKLASLVPPPRINLVRYHGVLALPRGGHRASFLRTPKPAISFLTLAVLSKADSSSVRAALLPISIAPFRRRNQSSQSRLSKIPTTSIFSRSVLRYWNATSNGGLSLICVTS